MMKAKKRDDGRFYIEYPTKRNGELVIKHDVVEADMLPFYMGVEVGRGLPEQ